MKKLLIISTLVFSNVHASYWQQILFSSDDYSDSLYLTISDEATQDPHQDARRLYELLDIHPNTFGTTQMKTLDLAENSSLQCSSTVIPGAVDMAQCNFTFHEFDAFEDPHLEIEIEESERSFRYRALNGNAENLLENFLNHQEVHNGVLWQSSDQKMSLQKQNENLVIVFREFPQN